LSIPFGKKIPQFYKFFDRYTHSAARLFISRFIKAEKVKQHRKKSKLSVEKSSVGWYNNVKDGSLEVENGVFE